jgi:hypothetical protein
MVGTIPDHRQQGVVVVDGQVDRAALVDPVALVDRVALVDQAVALAYLVGPMAELAAREKVPVI